MIGTLPAAFLEWLRALVAKTPKPAGHPRLAMAALKIAQGELRVWSEASTETHRGLVDAYLLEQAASSAGMNWCALFVSYCLLEAAHDLGYKELMLTLPQRRGAIRLGRELVAKCGGRWLNRLGGEGPQAGDIAVYHRGARLNGQWSWQGHIRFVESAHDAAHYLGIGGNERGAVRRVVHPIADPRLIGFIRLG